MKHLKIFIIIFAFVLNLRPVLAFSTNECDVSMCPTVPKVSGPIASTLSKVTGMNFLLSKTIEAQVKKQMDKALTADFDVKITPFGAKSMMEGKFEKITAHAESAYIDGFYISNINAESLCGYNHFIYKNGQVYTNENFLLGFSADVTSNDLQKIVNTPEYMKLMNSLNVSFGGVSVFRIFNPKAEIKNGRLVFSMSIVSPLTMGQPKMISSSMGMSVENGQIVFSDVQTTPAIANANLNALLPIINRLNPLTFKTNILNNSKSIIKIQNLNVLSDKIVVKGLVIVPKNYYNN